LNPRIRLRKWLITADLIIYPILTASSKRKKDVLPGSFGKVSREQGFLFDYFLTIFAIPF
jgi:hypothetical protein